MAPGTPTRDPVAEINALVTATGYNTDGALRTQYLGIDTVCPSPSNPRKKFDPASMAELVDSVRRHGVLEPILVRPWPSDYAHNPVPLPMYELVAGERRWRAAREAGMQLIEGKIRHLTDREMLEIMVIENLQREGLTPLEEAEGYEVMHRDYKYSADDIAEKIGKSKAYVYGRLKLTALCQGARKALAADKLSATIALLIARIPVTSLQEQATLDITNSNWQGECMSYRAAAEHVQRNYMLKLTDAPFPANDSDLVPSAGSCKHCPKRTGNSPGLFDDVKNANVCTEPVCFKAKVQAHKDRQIKDAKAQGVKVITGKDAEKINPNGIEYGDLRGGMTALDGPVYVDGKKTTYRKVIGDDLPPVVLVEDRRSGGLVQAVETKQIAEALKAAGINKGSDLDNNKQRSEEAKAKAESEFRKQLHARIRDARRDEQPVGLEPHELTIITTALFDRIGHDTQKQIVRLWAPTEDKADINSRIYAFQTAGIPALSRADQELLLLDMAVIGETHVAYYNLDSTPTRLLALAGELGIDAAQLKKQLTVEAKAKAKGSKAKVPAPETQLAKPVKAGTKVANSGTAGGKSGTAAAQVTVPEDAANDFRIGDRVRIKAGSTWADGKPIKSAEVDSTVTLVGAYLTIRTDSGFVVNNLVRSHLERIDAAATTDDDIAIVGDRVRIKAGARFPDGYPAPTAGHDGVITKIKGRDFIIEARDDDGDMHLSALRRSEFVLILDAKTTSTPVGAARAAGDCDPAAPAGEDAEAPAVAPAKKPKSKTCRAPAAPSNEPASPAGVETTAETQPAAPKKRKPKANPAPAKPANGTPTADASASDDDLGITATTAPGPTAQASTTRPSADVKAWPFPVVKS